MSRWLVSTVSAAIVAAVAFLSAGLMPRPDMSERNIVLAGDRSDLNTGYRFDIEASPVRGLYPGATRPITLTFTNSYAFGLRVTSIKGELVGSSKRGCRPIASNLKIASYRGRLPLTVPPESRASAEHLEVRMPNAVADACRRAEFTIRITGFAAKVTR